MPSHTVREAVAAFRRAPVLTGLSAGMVALALFVVGLFGVAAHNLRLALATVEDRVEVVAYLSDVATSAQIDEAALSLQDRPGVAEVTYVTKEEALRIAREDISDLEELVADLEVNPFPASLEIRLHRGERNAETIEALAAEMAAQPFVDDVRYGQEWVERLFSLRQMGAVTAGIIGGAFAVVAALIIGTAIRIAIFARRDEIYIMRLVGATDGFIRRPFILEGAFTGLIGGVVATTLTWVTFRAVLRFVQDLTWIPTSWVLAGTAMGVLLGMLSSAIAVRRHLREV